MRTQIFVDMRRKAFLPLRTQKDCEIDNMLSQRSLR